VALTPLRPSPGVLARLLARLVDQPVTYPEVGATRAATLPAGYRHVQRSSVVGAGAGAFGAGRDALRRWEAQRRAGARLTPEMPALAPGTVVVSVLRVGPLYAVAPCRVVYVTDEDARFGFAYGTLPGHPERGEESFHVSLDAAGTVRFDIVAFSRPATLLSRLGGPVARRVQDTVTDRYVDGVSAYVARAPSAGSASG